MSFVKVILEDGSEEFRHVDYDELVAAAAERDADSVPPIDIPADEIAAYEAAKYQRDRAQAYPSIQDQLDTLYHGGIEAWRAQVQAVKDQFPKPEGV